MKIQFTEREMAILKDAEEVKEIYERLLAKQSLFAGNDSLVDENRWGDAMGRVGKPAKDRREP